MSLTDEGTASAGPPPGVLIERASEIGWELHRTALWHDGRALWLGDTVEPSERGARVVHHDVGTSLYDGTAGIGWFLANLAPIVGGAAGIEAATDARGALRHAIASNAVADGGDVTLYGGAAGIGWAALDAGLALDDEELAAAGIERLLAAVEGGLAIGDGLPAELIGGLAGLVMAALAGADIAQRRLARPDTAERLDVAALALGRAVARAARPAQPGLAWPTMGDPDKPGGVPALCGLGHGQSGPVLACATLAARFADVETGSGEPTFAEATRLGMITERAWLSIEAGGWPDLRGFDRPALERGEAPPRPGWWCHGSVGIGLARVRVHRLLGLPLALADATVALHLASRAVARLWEAPSGSQERNVSLCHGAAGLSELFVVAAGDLGEAGWLDGSRAVTTAMLANALGARSPAEAWPSGVQGGPDVPGLMLGLAGAGTAFLRLAATDRVASPLLIGPSQGRWYRSRMLPERPGDEPRALRRVVVKLDAADGTDPEAQRAAADGLAAVVPGSVVERVSHTGRVVLSLPEGADPTAVAAELGSRPGVSYAEPDVVDRAVGGLDDA